MNKRTVIYDNTCRFCATTKNRAEMLTSELTFIGAYTPEGEALIKKHQLDPRASAYVIDDAGIHQKSMAIEAIFQHMGMLGSVLRFGAACLPRSLKDRAYDFVARHRS